jgi:hypothetical protein
MATMMIPIIFEPVLELESLILLFPKDDEKV